MLILFMGHILHFIFPINRTVYNIRDVQQIKSSIRQRELSIKFKSSTG